MAVQDCNHRAGKAAQVKGRARIGKVQCGVFHFLFGMTDTYTLIAVLGAVGRTGYKERAMDEKDFEIIKRFY